MKKRVLLLGLVVLMVLTGCGTTEKETKTKEKDPDKLVLNIEDKKEDNIKRNRQICRNRLHSQTDNHRQKRRMNNSRRKMDI